MRGSLTSQSPTDARDFASTVVAFRHHGRRRPSDLVHISRLNTPPACAPVNASPSTLQLRAHDSGPVWLARPSPYGSFIHYSTPVYPGAPMIRVLAYTLTLVFFFRQVRSHFQKCSLGYCDLAQKLAYWFVVLQADSS